MVAQRRIPAVIMRGGSSRGVFFHERDLPTDAADRDAVFQEVMGCPDPLQVDGLGGTYSSNSKVMTVGPGDADADISYAFGQVAVGRTFVDHRGNCGNLTAAVGAFAVDEGLVPVVEPATELTARNRNTGVLVRMRVPVIDGLAAVDGEKRDSDVVAPGAPILTTYLDPGGSVLDGTLPTGSPTDRIAVDGLGTIEVSIVDVTSPVVFVAAADLGLRGDEDPHRINADPEALARVELVRGALARHVGLAGVGDDPAEVSPSQPKLAVCASGDDGALLARIFSMGRMHHAFTMTGVMCAAAACALEGTIPRRTSPAPADGVVRVRHPRGVAQARIELDPDDPTEVASVGVERTARRIMVGEVYLRKGRTT